MSLKRYFQRLSQQLSTSSAQGLTLIECLVAISIIAITGAVIAPPMVFAVATRIQSQRADQALQVAQGEIDQIRQIVEQGVVDNGSGGYYNYGNSDLKIPSTTLTDVTAALAPNAASSSFTQTGATAYRTARSIDVDDDGELDFAIQAFRTEGREDASGKPVAFRMGVRVYDYNAVLENSTTLETTPSRLGQTSGEGERGKRPLAVLYTDIVKSDERQSLCEYYEYQGSATSTGALSTALDCSS